MTHYITFDYSDKCFKKKLQLLRSLWPAADCASRLVLQREKRFHNLVTTEQRVVN